MFKLIILTIVVTLLVGCASHNSKMSKYAGNRIDEDGKLDVAVTELTKGLGKTMIKKDLYNVAVIQFIGGDESTSAFGRIISEKIAGKLAQLSDEFSVIERKHLTRMEFIREQDRQRIDGSIRTVITGSYQELDHTVDISSKLIDVRTGKVYAATTILVPKTQSLIWALTSDQYIKRLH